ncbi:hypothetical protein FQN54_001753 [Arachnomyces sp. PD_36]|nr:hypothetical protein FQN54_001753 [Arachnomyces sp. PD_36]
MPGGYRADPFAVLPVEIAIQIARELAFRDICSALRVSKGWKSTLISEPALWKNVDITSTAMAPISTDVIRSYFQNAQSDVNSFMIGNVAHTDADSVLEMLYQCANLKRLEIQSHMYRDAFTFEVLTKLNPRLTTLRISHDCAVAADVALRVLQRFRHLERVQLVCTFPSGVNRPPLPDIMPRLQIFSLRLAHEAEAGALTNACLRSFIREIPRLMPQLTDLFISGSARFPLILPDASSLTLQSLNFKGRTIPGVDKLPPSLEYLKLDGGWLGESLGTTGAISSLSRLRGLFITTDIMIFPLTWIPQSLHLPESLQILRMPSCCFVLPEQRLNYHAQLQSLKIVDLSAAYCLKISYLTHWLSQTEARLSHLSLAHCVFEKADAGDWYRLITTIDWSDLTELDLSNLSDKPGGPEAPLDRHGQPLMSRNRWRHFLTAATTQLNSCKSIGEVEDLANLINTYMPNLEVLNLTGCDVGIATIKALIDGNGGRLKKLIAVDCVSDNDFPELLKCGRHKGVKVYSVPHISPDPSDTPKRVRGNSDQGSEQWGYVTPMRDLWEDDYSPFISLERDIETVFFE